MTAAATPGLGIRLGSTRRIILGMTPIGTGMILGTMVVTAGTVAGTVGTTRGITITITIPGTMDIMGGTVATIPIMAEPASFITVLQVLNVTAALATMVPEALAMVVLPPIRQVLSEAAA